MTRTSVFCTLWSNITAFFIFLYPETYAKVSAESVIRIPEPLLVSVEMLTQSTHHISPHRSEDEWLRNIRKPWKRLH